MDKRRLVHYLLINALVSALVTGTILFVYDLIHRADCRNCQPGTSTTTPGGLQVAISGIIGAGSIEDERVIVVNSGSQPAILTGWTLKDSRGIVFTFPEMTLFPEGTVEIHSDSGRDSLPDLYWDRSAPVWQSGELAGLYDGQNIARAFFRVP